MKNNNHVNVGALAITKNERVEGGGCPNNDSLWGLLCCRPQEPNESDLNEIVFKIIMRQKVDALYLRRQAGSSPSPPFITEWWSPAGTHAAEVWHTNVCCM